MIAWIYVVGYLLIGVLISIATDRFMFGRGQADHDTGSAIIVMFFWPIMIVVGIFIAVDYAIKLLAQRIP